MSFSEFKNSSVRVFRVVVIGFDSAKKCTNQNKLIKKLKKKKKTEIQKNVKRKMYGPKAVFGWVEMFLSLSISRLLISKKIASSSSFSFVTMISSALFQKPTRSDSDSDSDSASFFQFKKTTTDLKQQANAYI